MRHAATLVAGGLLLALTACGGGDPESGGTGSETPAPGDGTPTAQPDSTAGPGTPSGGATVADAPEICRLLSAKERKSLVGKEVDRVIPVSGAGAGYTCRWVEANSLSPSTLVQVTAMPSPIWAKTLPAALQQMEQNKDQLSAPDRKELARAQRLVANGKATNPKLACGLFTTLSEIGGAPKGAEYTVNLLPVGQNLGVSAQTCTNGRFTSVVFTKPGLKRSEQLNDRAVAVLRQVHDRAQQLS